MYRYKNKNAELSNELQRQSAIRQVAANSFEQQLAELRAEVAKKTTGMNNHLKVAVQGHQLSTVIWIIALYYIIYLLHSGVTDILWTEFEQRLHAETNQKTAAELRAAHQQEAASVRNGDSLH